VQDNSTNAFDRLLALQIIDANINRASEGLRVVEEYCRFALRNPQLTTRCKELRDALHVAIDSIGRPERLMARDTTNDVGTMLMEGETFRHDVGPLSIEHIAVKNGERVKEALRVIEEYCKSLYPEIASAIGVVRYQWYTLERDCHLRHKEAPLLANARLYVLIDAGSSECGFAGRARSLINAGVHILQLRDKKLDDRTLLSRAWVLRGVIDETDRRVLFIMNDRADLAVLARADGIHVGQEELSVRQVRAIIGPKMLVGVSTHNIEQARQAVRDGADYIGCGPVFPSPTKHFDHFPGLDFLREVSKEISLPAFAIGGINRQNIQQVIDAGFKRAAVQGGIAASADPDAEIASLLQAIGS
jgi:thiamine-phosphate pyrophosphorylase